MEDIDDNCLSLPAGHIRETYSNAGWIAIARDGGGHALGVDLDPGPMGTVGQVITFGRDIAFVHRRSGLVVELMTRAPTNP